MIAHPPEPRPAQRAAGRPSAAGAWVFDATTWPWLRPILARRRGVLLLLLGLGLVAAGAALAPPYLTKLVIDEGLIARDRDALVTWSVALFIVGFASLLLGVVNSLLHMRASVGMLAELRHSLVQAVLGRSMAWRSRHQTGELMARLDGDAGEVQRFAFNVLLTGTGSSLRLVGGAIMLFVLNWQLALLALALAPLELLFLAWARPRTEALAQDTREERGGFAARLAEMLTGLGQIQAARGENQVARALDGQQNRLNRALLRAQLWAEFTRATPATLTAVMRSAIFLIGGLMVIQGSWPLGSLIAFTAYLGFLIGPMQSLLALWHDQARIRASLDRLATVIEPETGILWPARPTPLPPGPGELVLDGVAVRAGDTRLVQGLTATVPGGAKWRIAGPSGIGKTSLLALLQRHGEPDAGRITLDGVDLRQLSRVDLRQAITLVPQRPFLIRGTVGENLTLSAPDADAAAMAAMIDSVGLTDRFAPAGGLDAVLGEDGLTLSGGERQRLCLARALLAPGRVLVLDEALSEVDAVTIRRIIAVIDDRFSHVTRLIATHGAEAAHGPFDAVLDLAAWRAEPS